MDKFNKVCRILFIVFFSVWLVSDLSLHIITIVENQQKKEQTEIVEEQPEVIEEIIIEEPIVVEVPPTREQY